MDIFQMDTRMDHKQMAISYSRAYALIYIFVRGHDRGYPFTRIDNFLKKIPSAVPTAGHFF